jgi:hypothetical protein
VHEPVIVNSSTFPEPALLATCKEIRDEALDILYAECSFETDIQDYDSTPPNGHARDNANTEKITKQRTHQYNDVSAGTAKLEELRKVA